MKKLAISSITIIPMIIYILLVTSADKGTLPPFIDSLYDFPNGDKYGHLIIMGVISFCVLLTTRLLVPALRRRRATIISILLLFLLFTIEEFSQRLLPSRTFSWLDLLCSYGGALTGITLAVLFTLRRKKEAVA